MLMHGRVWATMNTTMTDPFIHPELQDCRLCPRHCGVDRTRGRAGFCRSGAGLEIASICLHRGEEPPVGGVHGICNVFFSHCNLQCIYCQNHQISRNDLPAETMSLEHAVTEITAILARGVTHLGFVSPSHLVPQMKRLIHEVRRAGYDPVVVYNSNGYDEVETLRGLEEWVHVYLPDFKYMDSALAQRWSLAGDYPETARRALREMFRQKGSMVFFDERGLAERGLIIRHLVLPGQVENSLQVLQAIAADLSPLVHLSLMSQYRPMPRTAGLPPLDRPIGAAEYERVLAEMERLGFQRGWVQSLDSSDHYHPDFRRDHPFEG